MAIKIIVQPPAEPVTLAKAKEHLKIEPEDTIEDDFVTALIISAREFCEEIQNRSYVQRTIELTLDDWPRCSEISLLRPPIQSVESVKYYDTENNEHIWDAQYYFVDVDSEPGRIVPNYSQIFPTITLRPINAIKIRYIAGYLPGEPDSDDNIDYAVNVPQKVKQAILLLVGYWHSNREAALAGIVTKEVEFSVKALLGTNRVYPA